MGQIFGLDMKHIEQDERIDNYLRGRMSKEDEAVFENDLRSDADLRSRARFVAQTIKAMRRAEEDEGLMSLPRSEGYRMAAKNPNAKGKK